MTGMKRRLKVFLCHAHSDAEAVCALFKYLRREGVDVWLDKEKLLPGVDWDLEIRKAVRESDVVVVCLSKQFNQEGYRQREVKLALDTAEEKLEGQIFIIPARLEVCDVPQKLKKWHWVDLFEEGGRQKLIYALRARAENVGAALRRQRGRGPRQITPKDRRDNILDTDAQPSPVIQLKSTISSLPTVRKDDDLEDVRSSIRIDPRKHVWRGSEDLGSLDDPNQLRVLKYLIYHSKQLCSYTELYVAYLGHHQNLAILPVGAIRLIDKIIGGLEEFLEIDPKQPHVVIRVDRKGYMLAA